MRRMMLLIALSFLAAFAGCSTPTQFRALDDKAWSVHTGEIYVGTSRADVINICGDPDQSYKTKTELDAIEYQRAVCMEHRFKADIEAQEKFIVEFRDDRVARWYFEYWSAPKLVRTMKPSGYGN